ncbi:Tyrosine-protein phosphatase precursor [compost metagenome]
MRSLSVSFVVLFASACASTSYQNSVATSAPESKPTEVLQIPLEGQSNFRDVGGYKTQDGKLVRKGLLFRSGDLSRLTAKDLSYLSSIGLVEIVDFRTPEESKQAPDRIPASVKAYESIPVVAGELNMDSLISGAKNHPDKLKKFLVEANQSFVDDSKPQFEEFFRILQSAKGPLVFHCTAGKDRTGFATALFYEAMGVHRDIIVDDYMASSQFLRPLQQSARHFAKEKGIDPMALDPLLSVKTEYIEAAFDLIDKRYGGVEAYLKSELKVDVKKLRAKYLVSAP